MDRIDQRIQLIFKIHFAPVIVGIEPNVDPFSAEDHVQVVVSYDFVILVVSTMGELICFHRYHCIVDNFAVIDSAAVRAIAITGIQSSVMGEIVKFFIYSLPHQQFPACG
jgi:hypothetical protein